MPFISLYLIVQSAKAYAATDGLNRGYYPAWTDGWYGGRIQSYDDGTANFIKG